MAVKTPVRGDFNGSGDLTGLSEFQASDFIGISDGGTGAVTAAARTPAASATAAASVMQHSARQVGLTSAVPNRHDPSTPAGTALA